MVEEPELENSLKYLGDQEKTYLAEQKDSVLVVNKAGLSSPVLSQTPHLESSNLATLH